jgi:hypothetical protein
LGDPSLDWGMPPPQRAQHNRSAVSVAADVLSPELVLVSSPEEAARARQLLWETVPPAAVAAPKRVATATSRGGAALFDAACVAGTLGPLLLAVFSR